MRSAHTPLLPNVLAAIEPGSVVAMPGLPGSGKTVAARHLISRFLCDGNPEQRVFEPSIFWRPDHLTEVYRRDLHGMAAMWSFGSVAPPARALVVPTSVRDVRDRAGLEAALALIQLEVKAGDLVVVDEVGCWEVHRRLERLLDDLLDDGVRLLVLAQHTRQLPVLTDRTIRTIWLPGYQSEEQRALKTPGEMIIGGKVYRYVPTPEDLKWYAIGPTTAA